jgi:stearoyl-CoA desaturase (delta-9 desaturase)
MTWGGDRSKADPVPPCRSSAAPEGGEAAMVAIVAFFVAHWVLSVFCQTFFLHRYSAHRMFTMRRGWERFFYLCTFLCQGPSFLAPRAYAILHREHHAFSDTARDPHSPHHHRNVLRLLWRTKRRFDDILYRRVQPEARFEGGYPEWPALDRFGTHVVVRVGFGVLYTLFYLAFAPSAVWFLLLPVHYAMGPIHGTLVNWCGHKYGYRNFRRGARDRSRNTLPFDLVTLGELLQNNHHQHASAPNFAARWFEVDPGYWAIRVLAALRIVTLPSPDASERR